jgi:hypothetical protein
LKQEGGGVNPPPFFFHKEKEKMKPNQEQINAEIELLKEIKPKVRAYTMLGDDNRAAIQAAIEVLEKNLSGDDIWDRWPGERDCHERGNADDARRWMDGEEKESPSEGWKTLI